MIIRRLLLTLILITSLSLAGNSAVAQTPTENDQLRTLLRALQDKLDADAAAQSTQAPSSSRTTEIGNLQQQPQTPTEPMRVIRVYDLSDLFAVAPPYPAMVKSDLTRGVAPEFPVVPDESEGAGFGGGGLGGGGFGGGGLFSVNDDAGEMHTTEVARGNLGAARVSLDDLIDAICQTIDPDDWEQNGGESTIAELGNSLLVSAPKQTHDQIDNLLKLFRERWGTLRTISIRAYWLWLTDAQLDVALTSTSEGQPIGFGVLSDETWSDLQAAANTDAARPSYRAAITFYNGQTVHTKSGGQQLSVRGITPVVGGDQVAYSPETSVIQTGAALQITGMTTRRAEFVVLDLHSRVSIVDSLDDDETSSTVVGPSATVVALDRSHVSVQRLSTTTRVPVNQTVLIGGMSFDEQPEPGSPSLYLFVRAAVQELRDDRE